MHEGETRIVPLKIAIKRAKDASMDLVCGEQRLPRPTPPTKSPSTISKTACQETSARPPPLPLPPPPPPPLPHVDTPRTHAHTRTPVAPEANPVVCKIMDFHKERYQKKLNQKSSEQVGNAPPPPPPPPTRPPPPPPPPPPLSPSPTTSHVSCIRPGEKEEDHRRGQGDQNEGGRRGLLLGWSWAGRRLGAIALVPVTPCH